MSIYATLWALKFPKDGDDYPGCEWIATWLLPTGRARILFEDGTSKEADV